MKKKLQIFISSTYLDLQEEREAAVEAVLESKHIPAGMELFRAGNRSQLETIKKWIDESDIYMLILGGRYGSIEPDSGKSYTHLEYKYALEKEIPIFAVVLKDEFLYKKASNQGNDVIKDISNPEFQKFKDLVMSKMIKEVEDCKDIKLAIKDSISELEEEYDLSGWVRASNIEDNTEILKENVKLNKENTNLTKENIKLKSDLEKLKAELKSHTKEYEIIKNSLEEDNIIISGELLGREQDIKLTYLEAFKAFNGKYSIGVTNRYNVSELESFLYYNLAPKFILLGILDIKNVPGVQYRRIELSNKGKGFAKMLEEEKLKKL
ncbi:DUF4062 domain-containing protein [Clostridium perfringens]|uniref:DUF4062 domain-containing protein n=1 Tax=Clostridium perfringens TaxID=1502 RepID=UPI000F8C339B|nr:DUF4062 domain-containing protein [Clostridium perfringens]RUR39903.1 DUF4062 domain-containing protein [Clostridium perfringens]